MGMTGIELAKQAEQDVEFLVDSGAIYTLLPEKVCRAFKTEPRIEFSLAEEQPLRKIQYTEYKGCRRPRHRRKDDQALLGR